MDDAAQGGGGELEVTPEEARFLRGFFRRQLRPWAVGLVALSVTLSLALGDEDAAEVEVRTSSAVAQLRSENQKLVAEIERISARLETGLAARESESGNDLERRVEDAKHSVRMIEARITARLERRLDSLEAKTAGGQVHGPMAAAPLPRPGTGAPPPDASAWDVSQILDRLYALEMSQQEVGSQARPSGRLGALEQRVARLEDSRVGQALPADMAPSF